MDVWEDRRPGSGRPRVTIFGPNPLLSVTVEALPPHADDIHVHPAGQGVWVTRMVGELGGEPVLCGFVGGEVGTLLDPLLRALPGHARLVGTVTGSGCYVIDRRSGDREVLALSYAAPPSRHEVDDLVSAAATSVLRGGVLVVCDAYPGDAMPTGAYTDVVAAAVERGAPVLTDVSGSRLVAALAGGPDLVKLNDWDLAAYVDGPVDGPGRLRDAMLRLCDDGAKAVLVTRGGEPAGAVDADGRWYDVVTPSFARGSREGCGDAMTGGLAFAWARGSTFAECLRLGAAAGTANYLRHGLGTGSRDVIEALAADVSVRPAVTAA